MRLLSLPAQASHPHSRARAGLLGPCFKTGQPASSVVGNPLPNAPGNKVIEHSHSTSPPQHPLCQQTAAQTVFTYYFTLFPKCFSPFPRGTCPLSVSCRTLAFDGAHHRFTLHSQAALLVPELHSITASRGCHPLRRPVPENLPLSPHTSPRHTGSPLCRALVPLRSPLLGESSLVSFPPLTDMLKFSGSSCLTCGVRYADQMQVIFHSLQPLAQTIQCPHLKELPRSHADTH